MKTFNEDIRSNKIKFFFCIVALVMIFFPSCKRGILTDTSNKKVNNYYIVTQIDLISKNNNLYHLKTGYDYTRVVDHIKIYLNDQTINIGDTIYLNVYKNCN